jgi:hypothetical protein
MKGDMQTYSFNLTGVTPILMHANNIEERDRIEALRKKMKGGKAGDDRSPPESWKGYLYTSEDTGNVCVPSENILSCLMMGGAKVKVSGKETLKTHSQRVLFDRMDYDLLIHGKTIAKADTDEIDGEFGEHTVAARNLGFRLHVKPCKVNKASHVRVRPIFSGWTLSGQFDIEDEDANLLGLTALRDLFTTCGRLVGIGDWRPGPGDGRKAGQYGRFTAEVNRA